MAFCAHCGYELTQGALFCSNCGQKTDGPTTKPQAEAGERVLGSVLFGSYHKDICFTDRRVISFETMRDRYKFLVKALGPKPMVVETGGKIEDFLPFVKLEVLRSDISSIDLKEHGRVHRGTVSVVKKSGEVVELARLDVDVDKESYRKLAELVSSIYPEVRKNLA